MTRFVHRLFCVLYLLATAACTSEGEASYEPVLQPQPANHPTVYRVGIHPLHNPQRLAELYGPIIDHINHAMPDVELRLEASRNYEEFEKKLYGGEFEFAMPNPYQTILSLRHGYRVIAKMGDDEDFRGLILTRKDSNFRHVSDLKGKAVSYPAPTALAATLLPQHYLHTHGLDINSDIENRYVGSQESSIENVLRGHVAAAATWPVPWKSYLVNRPESAAKLQVRWQTDTLPNNGWVARTDLPEQQIQRFQELLLTLHQSPPGQAMLNKLPTSAFVTADETTYQPVREFLSHFSRTVRPIEH